ncbi:FxSxx-COOH system tetratricopeptide repeat protein [Dactylosporangium matsuzakiense]|uniref:Tetratricopeptide repeat protein n=1 Tax=Dactylosporangium matsuzakiense TaxID=53360 RepID=A0A9W6KTB0_9ACTN|nr:FxSxx-COOH system tetratricopeptide repeat protein [Dactylosporangium matsuzakiense]GLL05124.1 tetratricopeptide repeat protein [Dactylosporangium matsuzakiense]
MGDLLRRQLKELHASAGSPTADKLLEHSQLRGHSVSRAALAAVPTGTGGLRWATLVAFVDACAGYAEGRKESLPAQKTDVLTWRARFDQAYPGQRKDRPHSEPQQARIVGSVPGLADCFQPRALVGDLAGAGVDSSAAVLTPTSTAMRTWLLSGMGGVGKTQLAAHLARRLHDTGQLDLLAWITATSRDAIVAGYAQAAVDLALTGADGNDTERDAARFHAWLATTGKRWLVVLDDLSSPADVKGLWPPPRSTGRTVVTTRLRGSALVGPGRRFVSVGVFTDADAAAYVGARLADAPGLADDVDGLIAALYHLPLALAHATAYMIDEDIPCSEYQRRLAERGRKLEDLAPPTDELPDDYTRTVAATVSLSVQAADKIRPVGLASPLLNLASVLDPAGIPAALFTTDTARSWLAHTRPAVAGVKADDLDVDTVRSGLRVLHRLNLVMDATARAAVTVHGLVQRVTRDLATEEHLTDLARTAADALVEIWPDIESDADVAQSLRSNTAYVYQWGRDGLLEPGAHPVLQMANSSLGTSGNPTAAVAAFTQLATDVARVLGPEHPDTLATRAYLAQWRGESGDPAGAAVTFHQLFTDQLRVLGPDHPDTLMTRGSIARWRGEAGDPDSAAAEYEQLLTDQMRVLGPDHRNTLTTRSNLARWRGVAGDPPGAAAAYEQLLVDQVRILGPDDSDTLITRANLAQWRGAAGDPAGAAQALEAMLANLESVFSADDPKCLTARANLAYWRGAAGDPVGAAAAYEQLLADQLRVLGPDHPITLQTRINLAGWHGEAGDAAGAVEAFACALADLVRVFGPDHPHTLITRRNLAEWLMEAGDAVGATGAFEHLLTEQLRVLGPDHPDALNTRYDLAQSRARAGDAGGAVRAFEALLHDLLRLHGPRHPSTLSIRANLASWRGEAGDAAGAVQAFEELLDDLLQVLSTDHPFLLGVRRDLAVWRDKAGTLPGPAAEDAG